MIQNEQRQDEQLRKTEINPHNYHLSARGYLAELDRMQLEVREYLWSHPAEQTGLALVLQGISTTNALDIRRHTTGSDFAASAKHHSLRVEAMSRNPSKKAQPSSPRLVFPSTSSQAEPQ